MRIFKDTQARGLMAGWTGLWLAGLIWAGSAGAGPAATVVQVDQAEKRLAELKDAGEDRLRSLKDEIDRLVA